MLVFPPYLFNINFLFSINSIPDFVYVNFWSVVLVLMISSIANFSFLYRFRSWHPIRELLDLLVSVGSSVGILFLFLNANFSFLRRFCSWHCIRELLNLLVSVVLETTVKFFKKGRKRLTIEWDIYVRNSELNHKSQLT